MASMLLDDFRDAVPHFGRHPVTVPMSREEPSGVQALVRSPVPDGPCDASAMHRGNSRDSPAP
jgi:hypothetical protein